MNLILRQNTAYEIFLFESDSMMEFLKYLCVCKYISTHAHIHKLEMGNVVSLLELVVPLLVNVCTSCFKSWCCLPTRYPGCNTSLWHYPYQRNPLRICAIRK